MKKCLILALFLHIMVIYMKNSFKELEPVKYERASVNVLRFKKPPHVCCFPHHWHDRLEILRIEQGNMTVTCGNNDVVLQENDIILINSKEIHSAIAGNAGVSYTCIMFELGSYVNNRYYGNSYIKPLLFRQMRFENKINDHRVIQIIDKITEFYYRDLPTSSIRIEASLLMLLSILIESHITEESEAKMTDGKFTEVLDYIDTHFTEDLSITELSQKFGYNKSYFCRKFKNETGITCIDYVNSLKLDYAAIMLKGTPLSIGEIADKCGYSDANYFSRCFKEKYGTSPAEWKKDV